MFPTYGDLLLDGGTEEKNNLLVIN